MSSNEAPSVGLIVTAQPRCLGGGRRRVDPEAAGFEGSTLPPFPKVEKPSEEDPSPAEAVRMRFKFGRFGSTSTSMTMDIWSPSPGTTELADDFIKPDTALL